MMSLLARSQDGSPIDLTPQIFEIEGVVYFAWERPQAEQIRYYLDDRNSLQSLYNEVDTAYTTCKTANVKYDTLIAKMKEDSAMQFVILKITERNLTAAVNSGDELERKNQKLVARLTKSRLIIIVLGVAIAVETLLFVVVVP